MTTLLPPGARTGGTPSPDGARRRRRWPPSNPIIALAGVILGIAVLSAVLGPLLVGDPTTQSLPDALRPPGTAGHPLGTDDLGRDQLARLVHGARTSLLVASLAASLGGVVGVAVGMVAGYVGGAFDEVVMRIVDVQLAIPSILLVLTAVTVLKPSFPTIVVVLALSVWMVYARLARAQVLSLREQDMVTAIRSLGASNTRILFLHVLPNIAGPLLIITTMEVATLIMAEAALGYLGMGVPPPTPTLGAMISAGQTGLTTGVWWPVVVPGLTIALLILSINILGDWLRDRLDPRSTLRR
ncbi:ABC transporter permease [Streptosporangium sp. NPDC051022]|uniref:ABC transporter permease n=1 Tax=Streptosporangium sp. NPDC051022 TaxID=3155752 RepID=UPI00342E43A6